MEQRKPVTLLLSEEYVEEMDAFEEYEDEKATNVDLKQAVSGLQQYRCPQTPVSGLAFGLADLAIFREPMLTISARTATRDTRKEQSGPYFRPSTSRRERSSRQSTASSAESLTPLHPDVSSGSPTTAATSTSFQQALLELDTDDDEKLYQALVDQCHRYGREITSGGRDHQRDSGASSVSTGRHGSFSSNLSDGASSLVLHANSPFKYIGAPKLPKSFSDDPCHVRRKLTQPVLPTVPARNSEFPLLSASTVHQIIHGHFATMLFTIVDCRFRYEYEGGHIKGAVHIMLRSALEEMLFSAEYLDPKETRKRIIIFYCEFSSKRGPEMCQFLRTADTIRHTYPDLAYPQIYVMEGGYRNFFSQFPEDCDPMGYVTMDSNPSQSRLGLLELREARRNSSDSSIQAFAVQNMHDRYHF